MKRNSEDCKFQSKLIAIEFITIIISMPEFQNFESGYFYDNSNLLLLQAPPTQTYLISTHFLSSSSIVANSVSSSGNNFMPTFTPDYFQFNPVSYNFIDFTYPAIEENSHRMSGNSQQKIFKTYSITNNSRQRSKKLQEFKFDKKMSKDQFKQIRGRNSNSNIFRVFVKMLIKPNHRKLLQTTFEKLKRIYNYKLSFQAFSSKIEQEMPKFTNYINIRQFSRIYCGSQEENVIIRRLFHNFVKGNAITNLLTICSKIKIKKQSVEDFLTTLHSVELELTKSN